MSTRIYSAPRVFDVATLFVVTFAYAILFSVLSFSINPKSTILWGGCIVTFIGLCQAILFKGSKPRLASVIGGGLAAFVLLLCLEQMRRSPPSVLAVSIIGLCSATVGCGLGYLTGAVVGGVFLIADKLRQRIGRSMSVAKDLEVGFTHLTDD